MSNYGPIVAQSYTNLYLKIHPNDFFFKLCSMIGHNRCHNRQELY